MFIWQWPLTTSAEIIRGNDAGIARAWQQAPASHAWQTTRDGRCRGRMRDCSTPTYGNHIYRQSRRTHLYPFENWRNTRQRPPGAANSRRGCSNLVCAIQQARATDIPHSSMTRDGNNDWHVDGVTGAFLNNQWPVTERRSLRHFPIDTVRCGIINVSTLRQILIPTARLVWLIGGWFNRYCSRRAAAVPWLIIPSHANRFVSVNEQHHLAGVLMKRITNNWPMTSKYTTFRLTTLFGNWHDSWRHRHMEPDNDFVLVMMKWY